MTWRETTVFCTRKNMAGEIMPLGEGYGGEKRGIVFYVGGDNLGKMRWVELVEQ